MLTLPAAKLLSLVVMVLSTRMLIFHKINYYTAIQHTSTELERENKDGFKLQDYESIETCAAYNLHEVLRRQYVYLKCRLKQGIGAFIFSLKL